VEWTTREEGGGRRKRRRRRRGKGRKEDEEGEGQEGGRGGGGGGGDEEKEEEGGGMSHTSWARAVPHFSRLTSFTVRALSPRLSITEAGAGADVPFTTRPCHWTITTTSAASTSISLNSLTVWATVLQSPGKTHAPTPTSNTAHKCRLRQTLEKHPTDKPAPASLVPLAWKMMPKGASLKSISITLPVSLSFTQ
jgi:hypothetical protein